MPLTSNDIPIWKLGAAFADISQAMALLDQKTVTDVLGASSIGEASADVLEKFAKFGQCAIDSGLVVRNNKPGLTQNSGALVASDNVRVLQAAEIGMLSLRSVCLLTRQTSRDISPWRVP